MKSIAMLFLGVVLLAFFVDVSKECALPFWWTQQYTLHPVYIQGAQPKSTYRYRQIINQQDPNNYFHIQEFSQYTWWEHSSTDEKQPTQHVLPNDVRHMPNIVFGKDANTFGFPPRFQFDLPSKTNRHFIERGKTNNIFPREDNPKVNTNSKINTNGMLPKESIDRKTTANILTSGMTPNFPIFPDLMTTDDLHPIFPVRSTPDGRNPADGRNAEDGINTIDGVNTVDARTTSEGRTTSGVRTTSEGRTTAGVRTTLERRTTAGVRTTASVGTTTNERATSEGITTTDVRTTVNIPPSTLRDREETSTESNLPITSTIMTVFDSERERNENEELIADENADIMDNDLEGSSTNKASANMKETNNGGHSTFFGGWFGKKIENETGPCKVSETSMYSLRSMIENMFSFPREHVINPESKEKVREDILNKFRNFGLQVWTQNFTTPPLPSANGTEDVDEGVNLIGVIPGSQRGRLDDEIVLVGAHYDTVPDSNGVDDNGSGLAVMLEIARAITEARCRLNHTLMFVAFDHEENGAMGSNYFVDHYLIPEELKRARARFQGAFILDGILNYNDVPNTQELPPDYTQSLPGFEYFINNTGNRGNFLAMISRNEMDNHLSQKLMKAWQDLGQNKYKLFNLQVDMGNKIPDQSIIEKHVNFLTSDHATFWYHNSSSHFPESLNAVLLTDTGPFRGQMKKCYHSKCDDLRVISPEKLKFAKKTADALTATLVEMTSATAAGNCLVSYGLHYVAQVFVLFWVSKLIFTF